MFFPHTREWSPASETARAMLDVFPAHAGVIPGLSSLCLCSYRFSRTRGSDPGSKGPFKPNKQFFPHTREWSRHREYYSGLVWVFPAHAGVIHLIVSKKTSSLCFSRTRGSDPSCSTVTSSNSEFFPHTREWSYDILDVGFWRWVFPAHAGVIPGFEDVYKAQTSFSRTRGSDPKPDTRPRRTNPFFPHTREWSWDCHND